MLLLQSKCAPFGGTISLSVSAVVAYGYAHSNWSVVKVHFLARRKLSHIAPHLPFPSNSLCHMSTDEPAVEYHLSLPEQCGAASGLMSAVDALLPLMYAPLPVGAIKVSG